MRVRVWPRLVVLVLVAYCSLMPGKHAYSGWTPPMGGCHDGFADYLSEATYDPKACSQPHIYETFHVGEFDGDIADEPKPPASTVEASGAWAVCDRKFISFFGGQWRDRKIELRVGMPTDEAWDQGASWFSCEAASPKAFFADNNVAVDRSFRDGFASMPQLEWGCAEFLRQGYANRFPCDTKHNAEFVGTLMFEGTYAEMVRLMEEVRGELHEACRSTVAYFVGVTEIYTGTYLIPPTEAAWNSGDHGVRCFLWLDDLLVSASLKGVGAQGWPLMPSNDVCDASGTNGWCAQVGQECGEHGDCAVLV